MAYVNTIFNKNFLEYASYVIRDRAIPDIEDGLKPVQRRILHTLFSIDDGKYHKVANVVGECMKYHPHGDASIYSALIVLANKEIFIDKQGNFGNVFTGDAASAARYIECRCTSLGKQILHNPEITNYVDSYDSRNKEPTSFRAKLPLVLILGAEGIAVGMSTKIVPHNILEVIDAERKYLRGEKFELYPDFQTGGLIDVSEYEDGKGKIITRAKLDTSDPKRIIVKELPAGDNTENLIQNIEAAAKRGKVKISSINDFTTDTVEIEIRLPRNVHSKDVEDALYAFTNCEQSISSNMLVIKNNMPQIMTATQIIEYHAQQLKTVLKDELEFERDQLQKKLHLRTLERIFIEERIYKKIETMKTAQTVVSAVKKGFEPYKNELSYPVSDENVEHLLKIAIRRISLYDINKNREEVKVINSRLTEIAKLLKDLTAYAINWLDNLEAQLDTKELKRRTKITSFKQIDVREAVAADLSLRYDGTTGYLGTKVQTGKEILKVSPYDRVFCLQGTGEYSVFDVPDKMFVGKKMIYCGHSDKKNLSNVLFTAFYQDPATKYVYIKRCRVKQFILNRNYSILPDQMKLLHVDIRDAFVFRVYYVKKPRLKILQEEMSSEDFLEKGVRAGGVRLAAKEVQRISIGKRIAQPDLF
ncbi:MAG TPA: DNA topoisomerase IV subunit A [Treponemataceae bacterium]|nr:DNA topoisomerase IV subunit A [Treponemataceae bacterium]